MDLRAVGADLSLLDLPRAILVDILLKISGESIFFCRCTCKLLREIISEPQFAKLYFCRASRSDVYPLLRPIGPSLISRTLYLVDLKLYMLEHSIAMKLETSFKIPLHKFEMAFEIESFAKNQSRGMAKRKRCLKLNPNDHKFDIVNSCNGLLCLSRTDIIVVCNPVTGEFVNLKASPMHANASNSALYALGFSARANCYKVMNLFGMTNKWNNSFARIQILGSRSWKNIGLGPWFGRISCQIFFRGTLHWILSTDSDDRTLLVATFNFDNDEFGSFSPPHFANGYHYQRLGVLRERLCYVIAFVSGNLDIWVMREYSVEGSWTKISSVRLGEIIGHKSFSEPITQLENGAILLFHHKDKRDCGLIYIESESQKLRYINVKGITGGYEAIAFTPSFVRLKDVLVGDDLEILNVKSRCAEMVIKHDGGTPYLVQENRAPIRF